MEDKSKVKTKIIPIRMTHGKYLELQRQAEKNGLSNSAYIRQVIFKNLEYEKNLSTSRQ